MNASAPRDTGSRTAVGTATPRERRRYRRCKVAQSVRVRPSEFVDDEFEEVLTTENVSRDGIFFFTQRQSYEPGMGLFVTCPYSTSPGALNMDYIARVVRVEKLPDGRCGIAVHIISSVNFKA